MSGCAALVLALNACATATSRPPLTPQTVAEMEARSTREPANVDARVELAAAYLRTGRNQESARLLEGVVASPQSPPAASYFLGVAYEALDRSTDARRAYDAYLQRGSSDQLKRLVRGRLALLDRRELEQAVRASLAREQSLTPNAGAARVVGVFPFLSSAGPTLSPLSRALAELLSTDLNQTDRLTVVERAQVQILLDEIQLAETGAVDPQTAARAGRVLGAGRIVQGRLDGTEAALRIQALVVPVATPGPQPAPITQQGPVRDLFNLQNNIALQLYSAFGIELTVAERERVLRRPTENVQALLAFGLGLEAEDAQRYAQAVDHYTRAVALDNNFQEARDALERAQAKADAADEDTEQLTIAGDIEFRRLQPPFAQPVRVLPPGGLPPTNVPPDVLPPGIRQRDRFGGIEGLLPYPGRRDPVSEVLGTEGIERSIFLRLLIFRPGGSR